jgi:Relaxase/Mobilisation nuclease domain.
MATIAKVSNAASATFALGYGLGENTPLHHDTKSWLADHDLAQPAELENCRAVVVGGTNGIDPLIANEQFRAVRQLFQQTQKRNQVLRITQSFADNELDPLNQTGLAESQ